MLARPCFARVPDSSCHSRLSPNRDALWAGYRVRTWTCAEQFRCRSFAQLPYRESLRDIKACLSAIEGML
jgi:hypothetical protein